ncbi:MAG TPA: hypothetical protein PLU52_05065 [Opitutaceae bacterium]|nr:hypothetical protein [Opitutaceae bacterium]
MRPVRVTTTNAASSSPVVLDYNVSPFAVGIGVKITSGTPTYTVQYTFDDVFSPTFDAGTAKWFDHTSLSAKTTDADSNIAFPVMAVRVTQTGTGVTVATFIQATGAD